MNLRFILPVVFLLSIATGLPALAQDTYGPVRRGEDLWDIAKRIYHDQDVSRDQVMLALLKANPQAFDAPCNANFPLKVGVKLRIPPLTQVSALDREQARKEFERQLQEWEEHRLSGEKLVCPPATTPIAVVTPAQPATPTSEAATPTTPAPETAPPTSKLPATPAGPALEQYIVRDVEWAGIPILMLLIIGIIFWKYRRPSPIAAPPPIAAPAEGVVDYAQMTVEETLTDLSTDRAQGLSAAEAVHRLQDVGPNALEEKRVSLLQRLLPYFWGPIPWMIEAAALLSLLTRDWKDFLVITALLLFNAIIGFREEASAASALAALKGQLALKARVLRDGEWREIEARDLAPGDIVRLRLGDIIPADAKLIDGDYLSVDQAALTGESLPANKKIGDLAFSGAVAKQGEMLAVVTGTGANTFFGRTAKLVESAGAKSHLQESVLQIGNFLIFSALALIGVLAVVELYWGTSFLHLLKLALILLVASIPVAMPAVLSVTLALGALKLSKLKAIVSRMEAIEELAGVDILCSDKTGTLTQNKLTLGDAQPFGVTAEELILAGALASKSENNDAIDLAVIGGLRDASALKACRQIQFTPFDPVGKRTEATVQDGGGQTFKVTKGAPQVVMQLCQVDRETQVLAERAVDEFAAKGFRTLGVARADVGDQWVFLGILPLFDPPREDSASTIAKAGRYGIAVKMVTGDNLAIAKQISGQLGIGTNIRAAEALFAGGVAHGKLPAAAVHQIEQADGFAQVFPEHKYSIVKALQQGGHLVAMTGDGVNDAPALKQADVGIAVSGATDAARAAAALVLTAPGLSVITHAVEESRRIFERMMSYIIYRIAMSIDIMVFVVLASIVFGFFPLTTIMLVALALLDDVPIMTIAYDNTDPDPKPVRWNRERTFAVSITLGALAVAQSFGLLALGMEVLHLDAAHLQTMMFLQLLVGGHLLLLLTRTKKAFWAPPHPSWPLLTAVVGTQMLAVLMCGFGWLTPALSWDLIGWVWAYNLIWMVVQDGVKLVVYRLIDHRTQHRQVFATHAGAFLQHANVSAQPVSGA
jgi:H+-transporting ATPase